MCFKTSQIKTLLGLGLFTLFISGCSTTKYIKPAERFSHNGKAKLVTKDDTKIKILSATKIGDSLMFSGGESSRDFSFISLTDVEKITVTKRGKGALQGMGIGALAGGIGLGVWAATLCEGGFECDIGLNIFVGVLAGVLDGAFWGAILGSNRNYVFEGPAAISGSSGDEEEQPLSDTTMTFTKFRKRQVHKNRRGGLADDK